MTRRLAATISPALESIEGERLSASVLVIVAERWLAGRCLEGCWRLAGSC
jgi:hypothetical protein